MPTPWGPSIRELEADKYEEMYSLKEYSDVSPGRMWSDFFVRMARPKPGDTMIDFGTGTGKAAHTFEFKYGMEVKCVDLMDFRSEGMDIPFIKNTIWDKEILKLECDYAFCLDMMEHIHPEFSMLVVSNILHTCKFAFFGVSFQGEGFGKLIGEEPHVNVKPFVWWRQRFAEIGEIIDCRDMALSGTFYMKGYRNDDYAKKSS